MILKKGNKIYVICYYWTIILPSSSHFYIRNKKLYFKIRKYKDELKQYWLLSLINAGLAFKE